MKPRFRFFGKVADGAMRMALADYIDFKNKFVYYHYHVYTVEGDDHEYGDVIGLGDCVLMQSTGLFDKNGQEIFGNDIVEWKHNGTGPLIRGIVKRDVDLYWWGVQVCRFDDLIPFGHLTNQRVTVLGNIYQNPDLVEEK